MVQRCSGARWVLAALVSGVLVISGVPVVDGDRAPTLAWASPRAQGIPIYPDGDPVAGAIPPDDFEAPSGTLTFQPGETSKTIPLTIRGDALNEADESALIALTGPTNATVGGFGVAGVTIVDDD